MRTLIYIITLTIILLSCKKDKLGPQCVSCTEENTVTETTSSDVLIINEGNFGNGSGALTLYKSLTKTVLNNVFYSKNGTTIGNVAQSAYQIDNRIYTVINNSNKIEVIDANDFSSLATIVGFNSPRYFLPINSNKAYVTDLYSNSIQVVDLITNSISGNISVSGWTEELTIYNDTVYACDMTNDNLLIIDAINNTLIDSVKVGESPNSIIKDKDNNLWVLCSGGFSSTTPKLLKFNPQTRSIAKTLTFPNIADSPGNLEINSSGDQLYYINQHVYSLNIDATSLNNSPVITNSGNTFYNIGVDPLTEEIYIADAKDYNQNGEIFRYNSAGHLLDQFEAGVIPGDFLFIK